MNNNNKTKAMRSKYKVGWVGLRVSRTGRAGRALRQTGWMRCDSAENRNGFDWLLPCKTRDQFHAMQWNTLAASGLDGIAVWFSDAQWGKSAGITDTQWQDRHSIAL